jgi:hypothetical protein
MKEERKLSFYEQEIDKIYKEIYGDSPQGKNSWLNRENRDREQAEWEARQKAFWDDHKPRANKTKTIKNLPEKFNRGKDGRILFETVGGENRITVVMNICFYGYGFEDLYNACYSGSYSKKIRTRRIEEWLRVMKVRINQDLLESKSNKSFF